MPKPMKVLIVLTDVEPAVRLNALFEKAEIECVLVSPLDDVRGSIAKNAPDVVVLTGGLFDTHNVQLVRQQQAMGAAVVGLADIHDEIIDQKLRSVGFVEIYAKPIDVDEVFAGVRRVLERRYLQRLTGLRGESRAMREVLVQVEQMAPVSSTVLIEGESGTGKELVARALHLLSPRRMKPFIAVNVGALSETLLESELFGHEKGAFTGAAERRLGRFELAHTGTLFLDEIGEIPPSTQVRLLRVLEEREMMRVGGTQNIRVDVRVIAATNRPLRELMETGGFRSDLYYRLNVLRIYLPPLRERREDIPLLVRRFVEEMSELHERPFMGISGDAMQMLIEYPWPGNVRELRNLVESMVVLAPGREISAADIPRQIREGVGGAAAARFLPVHVPPLARLADRAGAVGGGGEGGGVGVAGAGGIGGGVRDGRELEFIVRSLVELKMQIEELRRRVDDAPKVAAIGAPGARSNWLGEVPASYSSDRGVLVAGLEGMSGSGAFAMDGAFNDDSGNVVTVAPGTKMSEVERLVIEAALRETRGNRRKAADLLGIGERTMYRKLKEYGVPDE